MCMNGTLLRREVLLDFAPLDDDWFGVRERPEVIGDWNDELPFLDENFEERRDVKFRIGWWRSGFSDGAHAHILLLVFAHI